MTKVLALKQILNSYYINDNRVNYKDFDIIFRDLKHYKQVGFTSYIEKGQLVKKWILKKV